MINTLFYIGGVQMDLAEDYPIPVDFQVTDITNPGTRKVSKSLSLLLPNTPNNASVFKQLLILNKDNSVNGYDPNIRVAAFVQTGSSSILSGYFRLENIEIINGRTLWSGTLLSDEMSLFSDMGDKYIIGNTDSANDIDLDSGTTGRDYQLVNDPSSLVNDFADPSSTEVAEFFLIDKGVGTEILDEPPYYKLPWDNQRLALRFKHIWDRIFLKHGYTYQSDFISSNFFKNVVYLDTHKDLPKLSAFELGQIYALVNRTTDSSVVNTSPIKVDFNNKAYDAGNRFNLTTDEYTFPGPQRNLTINTLVRPLTVLTFTSNYTPLVDENITNTITVEVLRTGPGGVAAVNLSQTVTLKAGVNYTNGQQLVYNSIDAGANVFNKSTNAAVSTIQPVGNSDIIQVRITHNHSSTLAPVNVGIKTLADTMLEVRATSDLIAYGNRYYNLNVIADKHLQKDFILDVLKMFNLYLIFMDGKYIIEPRDKFYTLGTQHDWTDLVDRSQLMEIKPAGQVTWKRLQLYPAVDKDFYSKQYNTSTGQSYGQQDIINRNEFIREPKKVELKFSAPLSVSNSPFHPKIPHLYDMNGDSKSPVDGLPRYGYWAGWKESTTTFTAIQLGATDFFYTGYAYVGEFDDPNNPTLSVLFGPPSIIYYQSAQPIALTSSGLYDYYANEINNQTDLNAKIMTCYVNITPEIINKLKLYDTVVIDGVEFIISKIPAYNSSQHQPTQVELIQYIS